MMLTGSCHCGAVRFEVDSRTPVPYMRCYCSICRKTQGGGGCAINIMANARSLRVTGRGSVGVYRALVADEKRPARKVKSPARRHFCKKCGSGLWVADPRWPRWIYPFASAIDTPLPEPRERVHIMLDSAANWVSIPRGGRDVHFPEYPGEAIIDWHKRHDLLAP